MAVEIVGDIDRKIWEETKNCTQSHSDTESGSDNDCEMKVNMNLLVILILHMGVIVIRGITRMVKMGG